MSKETVIVIVSAFTDAFIAFGTGMGAAMAETHDIPSTAALLAAGIGALVIGARTVQQWLKTQVPPKGV